MKKVMFSLFVLLAGNAALATSVVPVTLSLEVAPLRNLVEFGDVELIQVLGHGQVMGYTCDAQTNICERAIEIDQLDEYSMKRIHKLVKRASVGATIFPELGGFRCLAIPTEHRSYSAQDKTIFLESRSTPCGDTVFNDTRASLDLVKMLDGFYRQYRRN